MQKKVDGKRGQSHTHAVMIANTLRRRPDKEAICRPEGSQLSTSFSDLAAIFVHQSSQNTSAHM